MKNKKKPVDAEEQWISRRSLSWPHSKNLHRKNLQPINHTLAHYFHRE